MYVSQITQISQIYANYVNSFSFIYPVSCPHITSIRIKKTQETDNEAEKSAHDDTTFKKDTYICTEKVMKFVTILPNFL